MSMHRVVRAMSTMSRRVPAAPKLLIEERQPVSPAATKTPGNSNIISSSSSNGGGGGVGGGGGGTITSVYQTNIYGTWRNVIITWSSKNLMNVSLSVRVESSNKGESSSLFAGCKIELKPWHFWSSKKGSKSFDTADDEHISLEVYWDLRFAKFQGTSPEPCSDYYVCLTSDDEILLVLGDRKKKAYKKTTKRKKRTVTKIDPVPTLRKEVAYGKKSFTARARFADGGGIRTTTKSRNLEDEDSESESSSKVTENEVMVESSASALGKDHHHHHHHHNHHNSHQPPPEMWISVDGMMLVHVTNLQWKFRGNETVTVNKQPLQVFWDVYAWLFPGNDGGCGVFTFKPVGPSEDVPETEMEDGEADVEGNSHSHRAADFCLTLHAWKID